MKRQRLNWQVLLLGLPASLIISTVNAQMPTAQERVAALKANIAASQASLHQYQWVETTVISLKGEVKSTVHKACNYSPDGTLQKVEIDASPPPKSPHGLRGRIAENKKEEMTNYMQNAVALVKSYVPPDPAKLQAVADAGDLSIQPEASGEGVKLAFANYEKPGDSLDMSLNLVNNQPKGMSVATYLDDPSDAVTMGVVMGTLEDGTVYPETTTLDAQAKNLTVTVSNSEYRKNAN